MAKGSIVVLKNNKLEVVEVELVRGECPIGYEVLKEQIGGYIEHVRYNRQLDINHIDMWCDEEGRMKNLQVELVVVDVPNAKLVETLLGPIVFTGSDGCGNSIPLTQIQISLIQEVLNHYQLEFNGKPVRALKYN